MLASILNSLKLIAKKPYILIVPFVGAIISAFLFFFFLQAFVEAIADKILYSNIIEADFIATLLFLIKAKFQNLLVMFSASLINLWFSILIGIYYSKCVILERKRKNLSKALGFVLSSIGSSLGLLIVLGVFFAAAGIISLALINLFGFNFFFGFLALIFFALFISIAAMRLFMFSLPAIAQKANVRKALQASWHFTGKFFWQSIALGLVLALITLVIVALQYFVLSMFENTLAVLLLYAAFNTFIFAFSLGTITDYYLTFSKAR